MKKKIMITVASLAALGAPLLRAISTFPEESLLVIAISAELWYCSA